MSGDDDASAKSLRDGWVRVADVAPDPGCIESVSIESKGSLEDLVVWTTATGVTCASEARCPHQWSHLAHEGSVVGEEIVCVSHFWRFGVDGKGWKQNVNGRRDPKGDLDVFPCVADESGVWVRLNR